MGGLARNAGSCHPRNAHKSGGNDEFSGSASLGFEPHGWFVAFDIISA